MGSEICRTQTLPKTGHISHSYKNEITNWESQSTDANDDESMNSELREKLSPYFAKEILASKNLLVEIFNDSKKIKRKKRCSGTTAELELLLNVAQNEKDSRSIENFFLTLAPLLSCLKKRRQHKQKFKMIEINIKNFIKLRKEDINTQFKIMEKIGQGGYGAVYKAICLKSGDFRAIKMLKKLELDNIEKLDLITEMEILKKLDHPNIIKLYDLFEDEEFYYVVTELCEGGTVLAFANSNILTDNLIKKIMTQLLSAMSYIHSFGIVHRDLKLQNLVMVNRFSSDLEQIQIKLIDFGIAVELKEYEQKNESDMLGTLLYMPPESLKAIVSKKTDIWSCGIIFYMILTKRLPYKFSDEDELVDKIERGTINRKNLHGISLEIKVFLMQFLQMIPQKRISAEKALKSRWLTKNVVKGRNLMKSNGKNMAQAMQEYTNENNLVSIIESYLVFKKINQEERHRLALMFQEIDEDKSGIIDVQELKHFYQLNCEYYNEQEIEETLLKIDKNKSGKIDFNQFITSMYNRKKLFQAESLAQAFQYFDTDGTGFLQKRQIRIILAGIQNEQVEFLFKQLDKDKDNKISKKQFIQYMNSH